MRQLIFLALLLIAGICNAQTDTSKWLRAFPITDYMVDLNDSTKVVQLEMPDGLTIKERQLGLLYGVYATSKEDAVQKGYGRCHLIKSNYYYFSIGHNESGLPLKKGDIIYTYMDKTPIYFGRIPKVATHFVRLLTVYDEPLYDRYNIFNDWTTASEKKIVDSMVADIKFTGDYFLKNDPSMNIPIKSGDLKDKKVLDVMITCNANDVEDFLDYINARPRNYAGREWKVSEIFATWLTEGSPKVVK